MNLHPLRVVMMTAQTVDETLGIPVDVSQFAAPVIYIKGTGTTSSGVITIEEADWSPTEFPYTGTWSSIITVNASDVTGGAQKAVHLSIGSYGWVRVRITTEVGGGGSVSVVLRANY